MAFSLRSSAFEDGRPIPARHTAGGENLSPPLVVRSAAADVELRPDDGGSGRARGRVPALGPLQHRAWPHPAARGVGHGVATEDLGTAVNDFGHPRYDGPAPPEGDRPHRYVVRLAALDVETLSQAPNLRAAAMWEAAQRHLVAEARLTGTYARG